DTLSASFTDAGTLDIHTASFDWGDSSSSAGAVSELNGAGSITGSHTFAAPGNYTVTLTVNDKDGGSRSKTFTVHTNRSLIILDPTASGALTLSGNAGISVPDEIQVNSKATSALV